MKTNILMFMASYGIQLRLSIYKIQWADYNTDHCEVMLKSSDFQTMVFTIDLKGRKLWVEFLFYRISIHFPKKGCEGLMAQPQ